MYKKPFFKNKYSRHKVLISFVAILAIFATVKAAEAEDVLSKVDASKYPKIKLSLSYAAVATSDLKKTGIQKILVRENGIEIKDIKSNTSSINIKAKADPLAIVMLLDASGSMAGKPMENAKAAANSFIGLLGENDVISVVSFNTKPLLLTDYTANKKRLINSINAIKPGSETALYDALSLGIDQIQKSGLKQRYLVLLSDGGDTVSKVKLNACLDKLKASKIPVYAITLKSPEQDLTALETITRISNGKLMQVVKSEELTPFYSRLAEQIKNTVEVEYVSPGFNTKDIDLDIIIGAGSEEIAVKTAYKNPNILLNAKFEDIKIRPIMDNWYMRSAILLLIFLCIFLFAYAIAAIFYREKSLLSKQLGMYDDIWNKDIDDEAKDGISTNQYVSKAFDIVSYFATKHGFTILVKTKLEQAGLPLRPKEYIFFHLLIIIVPTVLLQTMFANLFLTVLIALVLAVIPIIILQVMIDRRKTKFNTMLPDTVTMAAGSLRAGYSLLQSIAFVADEANPPISTEFKRTLTEVRLGLPIEVALDKMAKRVDSQDFTWVVLAINIQREVGGNLAEILDVVANTIRERDALKRQVRSLSAEGRISAYILLALPIVVGFFMFLVNRSYMELLFTNIYGLIMLFTAGVLMVIGIFWMRKIINIEV